MSWVGGAQLRRLRLCRFPVRQVRAPHPEQVHRGRRHSRAPICQHPRVGFARIPSRCTRSGQFPWARFDHEVALHVSCSAIRGLGEQSMSERPNDPWFPKPISLLRRRSTESGSPTSSGPTNGVVSAALSPSRRRPSRLPVVVIGVDVWMAMSWLVVWDDGGGGDACAQRATPIDGRMPQSGDHQSRLLSVAMLAGALPCRRSVDAGFVGRDPTFHLVRTDCR